MTAVPPRPAAPDATAGDGLREAMLGGLVRSGVWPLGLAERSADDLLALPALRDVLAAAARDAEKVRRVEELAKDLHTDARSMWSAAEVHDSETDELIGDTYFETSKRIRRALDPS